MHPSFLCSGTTPQGIWTDGGQLPHILGREGTRYTSRSLFSLSAQLMHCAFTNNATGTKSRLYKLSKACYIIRNAKTYTSAPSLKMIYYVFFYSVMSYGIIFWGNWWHSSIIFRLQKKVIRIMEGCGNRVSCRSLFKKFQILPLNSQYIFIIHHLFFIPWIRTGLQNPYGYGNNHVCLRGLVAK